MTTRASVLGLVLCSCGARTSSPPANVAAPTDASAPTPDGAASAPVTTSPEVPAELADDGSPATKLCAWQWHLDEANILERAPVRGIVPASPSEAESADCCDLGERTLLCQLTLNAHAPRATKTFRFFDRGSKVRYLDAIVRVASHGSMKRPDTTIVALEAVVKGDTIRFRPKPATICSSDRNDTNTDDVAMLCASAGLYRWRDGRLVPPIK